MADVKIRVVGEDKASSELKKVDQTLSGLKSGLGGLTDTFVKGGAAIAGIGATMKIAFDFGEAGAMVLQTNESFKTLLETIGAAPDLLEQLRAASRGTISDMDLMSSTATLLAGTQGELATALGSATPQLLEIAKAAQKLNPALGDTTFLYDSLALGIKRGSPMILDNLGLTIKLEEAYNKYAVSLGKAANELTVDEQKMALLNEVLMAGDVLINQAGGSVDSATDSFARLETATTNAGDALKVKFAPFLAQAADAAATLLTWNDRLTAALIQHETDVSTSAQTYEEYRAEMDRAAQAAGYMIDAQGNLIRIEMQGLIQHKELVQSNFAMSEAIWNVTGRYYEIDEAMRANNRTSELTEKATMSVTEAEEILNETTKEEAKVITEAGDVLKQFTEEEIEGAINALTEMSTAMELLPDDISIPFSAPGIEGMISQIKTLQELMAGLPNFAGGANGGAAGPGGAGNFQSVMFVNNYQPQFSFADEYELRQKLAPIINGILQEHGL